MYNHFMKEMGFGDFFFFFSFAGPSAIYTFIHMKKQTQ